MLNSVAFRYEESYNKDMSSTAEANISLLSKTVDFYRRSIENYAEYTRTERKPRSKRQLQARLKAILQELESQQK
jgi:hypothetical protein